MFFIYLTLSYLSAPQVKEVREVARDATGLVEDLQQYGRDGGGTPGWAAAGEQKLAARGVRMCREGGDMRLLSACMRRLLSLH